MCISFTKHKGFALIKSRREMRAARQMTETEVSVSRKIAVFDGCVYLLTYPSYWSVSNVGGAAAVNYLHASELALKRLPRLTATLFPRISPWRCIGVNMFLVDFLFWSSWWSRQMRACAIKAP